MLHLHVSQRSRIERALRLGLLAVLVVSLFASLPVGSVFARPLMASLSYQPSAELTAPGSNPNLGFGAPMALSGNTLVIGAPDSGKGAVYVFTRDENTGVWDPTPTVITNDSVAAKPRFGAAVAIENDTLVVGANRDTLGGQTDSGAVYVYRRSGTSWTLFQGGMDFYSLPAKGDRFGESLAISGNTIAVGAPYYEDLKSIKNSGTVYLFKWDVTAGKWAYVKLLQDPNAIVKKNRQDLYGKSLAVEGDTLVVGAPAANGVCNIFCGSVSIYSRNSGGTDNWGRVGYFQSNPLPTITGSNFGQAVAISGGRIVVGAPFSANSGHPGSVYVFEPTSGGSWTQVTKLTSPATSPNDQFGSAVGIDGDLLVVGSPTSDTATLTNPGAVFAFTRSQTTTGYWSYNPDLQPALSSPAGGDLFGSSVMVNGQSIIAGATGRTPTSGGSGQGAVYAFSLIDTTPGGGINHPPELDLDSLSNGTGYLATFKEPAYPDTNFVGVQVINGAGLKVVDVDNPNNPTLASATITLVNPLDGAKELLQATASGSVSVNAYAATGGMGVLELKSNSGTSPLSDFQAVLSSVKYKNTSWKPDTSYRYINVVVNDGTSDSNTAVSTVVIVPAKERPVVTLLIKGEAPYKINQPATVTVSVDRPGAVTAEAGVPSGTVNISVGTGTGAQTCAVTLTTLNAQGTGREGTCTVTITSIGSVTTSAMYNGDSEFSAWAVSTSFLFDNYKMYLPNLGKLLP